ncbi:MAG TPA: glycosyltransferase family 4 protein [Anaerolineaceae bacterium]|nr:glycosyltransferase family 4 protein [Anaerolineaceae bacterium]NMD26930.1 glycosyltransferase family 4 protein [Chloroflexota bacterium]HOA21852.1 glycosyltransferase family 4 protein [Anaerolineaceae bacterium]
MKIGIVSYRMEYYINQRLMLGKLPEAEYVPAKDWYGFVRRLANKLNHTLGKPLIPIFNLNNQFEDLDLNRVDLLHFFNGISYGRTPWVTSFETIVPRFAHLVMRHQGKEIGHTGLDALTRRGLEALAGSACLAILPLSQSAALMQKDLLKSYAAEYAQPILDKMRVLHPPQEVLVPELRPRAYSARNPIKFILVGAAFFRKGGREILEVFEKLIRVEKLPLRLMIVSSMRIENYAARETEADAAWALEKIAANSDWIKYYPELPNPETLALMRQADVGLLPSYADSYGFSVLEFQACGLPVITTDIRALPEINNSAVGWLIKVPRSTLGEALYETAEERKQLSSAISNGLEQIVRGIAAAPAQIAVKGAAALERLRREHDPAVYADVLRQVYLPALRKT